MRSMTIALFDLEETLIESWDDPIILVHNVQKIRNHVKRCIDLGETQLAFGIFSWAIWNEKDKLTFKLTMQDDLEHALGFMFDPNFVFDMEQISDIVLNVRKKKLSKSDMFDLFGKEECLLSMLRGNFFKGQDVILFDDVVDNMEIFHPNGSIQFINIKRM